ncbi:protein C3orf33 homolog isoform X2 [Sorex araneus]|uniref:protein C3orf33 homolog isoform X2 n=1 Tax=Sorex araneus TaxID=42254 RepID=UPI002433439C|nr:protein C3orf33 homolog isoform X2 [Sorex araneus]
MAARRGRDEPNAVARLSQWADDHLRLVRTSQFTRASDIPVEFLRKQVKLRGRVRRVSATGLEIEHIPVLRPPLARWRRGEPAGALQVRLAGVELTAAGHAWLREELRPAQALWFQPLGTQGPALLCFLLVRKGRLFSVNLNEEALRRGLGKAVPVDGLSHEDKAYWTVHRRLLRAELAAVRRGAGLWAEPEARGGRLQRFRGSWQQAWGRGVAWAQRLRQLLRRD